MNGDRYQMVTYGGKFCCWRCIKGSGCKARAKQLIHKKDRRGAKLDLRQNDEG